MKNTPVTSWRNQKSLSENIGKTGKIEQWTIIRVPSLYFQDQAPYPVAMVKMDSGGYKMLQLVDYQEKDLAKNTKVITVLRRIGFSDKEGVIHYELKCKPL